MSSSNNSHQGQKRRRATQPDPAYQNFSHAGGMSFHPSIAQVPFDPERPLVVPEGQDMQEDPEEYEHSALYYQAPEGNQPNQPMRAMSSPNPAQYMQHDAFPNIQDPVQHQAMIQAFYQFIAQNQAYANAGFPMNQNAYPPERRGHNYRGKMTVNGSPSIIKGNVYHGHQPPENMAYHNYDYNTFMGHNNTAKIFEGDLPFQALGQINFLPNAGQWTFSNGVWTCSGQNQPPPPPQGSYPPNMHRNR